MGGREGGSSEPLGTPSGSATVMTASSDICPENVCYNCQICPFHLAIFTASS